MNPTFYRPFRISDALVFIAATALGCAVVGANWSERRDFDPLPEAIESAVATLRAPHLDLIDERGRELGWLAALTLTPLLVSWTLAVGVVILASPRPARLRLARLTGPASCTMAGPVLGIFGAFATASYVVYGGSAPYLAEDCSLLVAYATSLIVPCHWLTMALLGRWRTEPTWIDRLSRILGLAWIVLAPIMLCQHPIFSGICQGTR
jgi:hypothetical protein